jgi:hypothetical protein
MGLFSRGAWSYGRAWSRAINKHGRIDGPILSKEARALIDENVDLFTKVVNQNYNIQNLNETELIELGNLQEKLIQNVKNGFMKTLKFVILFSVFIALLYFFAIQFES